MKKLYFILLFCSAIAVNAQTSFTRVLNNDSTDLARSFYQATNGDYYLLSTTNSFGQGNEDIQITRTNGLGDVIWSNTYGTSGTDIGLKIKPLLDGGFVVVGYSNGLGNNTDDGLIFKINSSGTVQWTRSVALSGEDRAHDVVQASDGNIYFTGYSRVDSIAEKNIIVGRISNSGSVSWIKSYGGEGDDIGYGIAIDNKNQLAVVGSTTNDSVTVGGRGDMDIQLLILNTGGTIIKGKNYGTSADEEGKAIVVTDDYKYKIVGRTQFNAVSEYDLFTVEIDTSYIASNSIWFGGLGNENVSELVIKESNLLLAMSLDSLIFDGATALIEISNGSIINSQFFGGFDRDATAGVEVSFNRLGTSVFSSGSSYGGTRTQDLVISKLDRLNATKCADLGFNIDFGTVSFLDDTYENNYSNLSTSSASLTTATNTNSDTTICCELDITLSGDTIVLCSGESVSIGVPSISGINYNWSSTTGSFTSTSSNPRVSPTANTGYKVVITSNSSLNCTSDSAEIYVKVNPRQTVAPISDTFFCKEESVQISGPSNMLFYSWTGKNTILSGRQVTISSPDTFALRMGDANTCIYLDTIVVSENDLPEFNLGADTTICENLDITLTGPSGMVDYIWNGVSSNNASFTTNVSQIHTLAVEDSFGCTFEDEIRILTNPSSSFSLGADTSFCEGEEFTIFGPGFLTDFRWNDTASSSLSLTVQESGTYWLEAYNSFDCPAFDTIVISEIAAPEFSFGEDTAFCEGGSVTLSGPADMDTYLWFNGSNDPTFLVTAQGLYFLTVTDDNGCSYTDSITIGVNSNPEPFLGNDTTILTGNSLTLTPGNGFAEYQWSTSESSPSISVSTSGTYWVDVVDNNGCEGSDTIIVQVSASVQYVNGSKFMLYPNPVSNVLTIETEGNMVGSKIELFNATGSVVLSKTASSNKEHLNVAELGSGIYWLKTSSNGKILTFRVVISR